MAKQSLKLMVGLYDQPQLDRDGNFDREKGTLIRRRQGETFDAQSPEEYDRLIALGAAVDPDKANAAEAETLRARLAELDAERHETEVRLAATEAAAPQLDPSSLSGKELDAALDSRGLSTEGKVDEKRTRLAEALSANPENPNAHTGA